VHPDESVALGAALLADSFGNIDAVTLLDALSMPIGFAMSNGRFRKIIDKNSVIPLTTSFRLPGPKEDSPTIELDIFQGDSEFIVDNEYLGTVKVPASAAGRRIDFRLNEECLLEVVVELSSGPRHVALATRDTPDTLKRALAEERAARARPNGSTAQADSGLFRSIRRILGRD
jgi:molecular chaperone DnaK